jgi:gluconolactonase
MITTLAEGLDHPECVAWGPDGQVYAGGEAGQVYRIDPETGDVTTIASTGGFCLGLALDATATVYVCDLTHRAVLAVEPAGGVRVVSRGAPERAMVTPNFPAFGDDGALYVSDSGSWPDGGGCIFRIAPDGTTTVWSDRVTGFANGLAISPDGTALYVVESVRPGVVRVPILPDGSAGEPEVVITLPPSVPDGLAFADDGTLVVSCYRPDRVYAVTPSGALEIIADDPLGTVVAAPTNVAFGRADRRSLFLASLGRWHIAEIRTSLVGAPLRYPPRGPAAAAVR